MPNGGGPAIYDYRNPTDQRAVSRTDTTQAGKAELLSALFRHNIAVTVCTWKWQVLLAFTKRNIHFNAFHHSLAVYGLICQYMRPIGNLTAWLKPRDQFLQQHQDLRYIVVTKQDFQGGQISFQLTQGINGSWALCIFGCNVGCGLSPNSNSSYSFSPGAGRSRQSQYHHLGFLHL